MPEIYRLREPVGTSWQDVEWITTQVLVGTYDDAWALAEVNDHTTIEYFDGLTNQWIEA
jgi:hypothetical protein